MQSESKIFVKIGHFLYQYNVGDNGLTSDQAEELANMILEIDEEIIEAKEEGFNEGYESGKEDGYDEGYDEGNKDSHDQ
jgi:flagellar biosynthesis/type III secretory pathway protein FliH